MYRPCLHCEGKKYDENYCPGICTYGEDKKRLKEWEGKLEKIENSNSDFTKGCVYCELKSLPGQGDYKFGREFDTEYQASVCIRSYKDDHFVLLYEDEETDNEIPIKFCPICGREL